MTALIVIPARYGSTRFPAKPLARDTGKFLIQHVWEQAKKAKEASRVLVATDDHRIFDAVTGCGGEAVMTSASHESGTDRIAEVIQRGEFARTDVVVNVQGDEPEIDPELIDGLIRAASREDVGMATVSAPFDLMTDVQNPNIVKVVTDQNGFALYFSRAAIPFDRDHQALGHPPTVAAYRKHLGIYAYKRDVLLKLARTPACDLEKREKLEQLRAMFVGIRIFVHETMHGPHGIDTPEDYAAFVRRYNQAGSPAAG